MRKVLSLLVIGILMSGGCHDFMPQAIGAEIAIKEGISYSILDSNWEQTTLAELYKLNDFSLNIGMRNVNEAVLDIGYDLGKFAEPLKVFAGTNPILKPIAPILELLNPSLGIYGGYKYPADQNEFDYGVSLVAIKIAW